MSCGRAPARNCILLVWLPLLLHPVRGRGESPPSGTARFILDGNRVYAHVEFVARDGTIRKTLAFVDLGSPSMILSEGLFQELHAESEKSLTLRIGEMPVVVDARTVTRDGWLPFGAGDGKVEALLPAGVMRKYQVRFDYARREMTFAKAGILKPEGAAVPIRVNESTGLIAVDATIDGKAYPLTVDNGSGYTWIRKSAAQDWLSHHPDWQKGTGAVGPSNMRMEDDGIETGGTLVRVPEIGLGSLRLRGTGALAIPRDKAGHDFMDWYSKKNAVAVAGWLGGNVLRNFRITIDYPQEVSYWLRQSDPDRRDLDYIGLTLRAKGGEYFVAGIATQNGKPTVHGARTGDKLIQIGGLRTHGASREAVFTAMHGKPGETRGVLVERDGKQLQLQARVTGF